MTTAPNAVASTAGPAKEKTPVVAQQGLIQNLGVACVSPAMEAQLAQCVPAVIMVPAIHRLLRPCANVIFLYWDWHSVWMFQRWDMYQRLEWPFILRVHRKNN